MDRIEQAIELCFNRLKSEHGPNFKIKPGDSYTFVMNDGVISISLEIDENGEAKLITDVKFCKPYKINFDLVQN